MIQVTQNFIDVVESESRQWRARLLYNGTDTGASIKALSVKGGSMSETTLNLCGCYSSSMEAIIDTGSFEFENKEIAVQFGLVLDDTTDPVTIEWVTTGYYTITEVERAKYQTTLTGAGRLSSKCGVAFSISTTQTVANIITAIQTTAGVTIAVDSGIDTTIEIEKEIQNTTCFGALQIVCSVLGCFAYDKYDGTIHIAKYPTTTTYTTSTSRMIQEPTFADNVNTITGVRVITQEQSLDEDGNPVPAEDYHTTPETSINYTVTNPYMTATAFTEYTDNLVGLSWYKATLPISLGDPRLEPTDMVSITIDGTTYTVPVHNFVHTFDGGLQTTITALGDSESLAESQQTGAVAQQLKEINADILNVKNIIAESISIAGHFFVGADGYVHITEVENDYTTGNNVVVDSDSVDIRDGTTTLASFGVTSVIGDPNSTNITLTASKFSASDVEGKEVFTITPSESTITKEANEVFEPNITGVYELEFLPVISADNPLVVRLDTIGQYFGETYELTFESSSDTPTAVFTPQYSTATQTWTIRGALSGQTLTLTFTPTLTQERANYLSVGADYWYEAEYSPVKIQGEPAVLEIYDMESDTNFRITNEGVLAIETEPYDAEEYEATWIFNRGGYFISPRIATTDVEVTNNINVARHVILSSFGKIKSTAWDTWAEAGDIITITDTKTLEIGNGPFSEICATTIKGNIIYLNTGSESMNTYTLAANGSTYIPGQLNIGTNNRAISFLGNNNTYYEAVRLNGNNNLIIGYGLYDNSVGTTYLDGNNLSLNAQTNITANQRIQAPVGLRNGSNANTTIADKNLSSGTSWQNLGSFSLPAGVWRIVATTSFASNATGIRGMCISTASSSGRINAMAEASCGAVNGFRSNLRVDIILNPSSSTTYYVNAFQNSGGSLAVTTRWNAEYIGSSIATV